jgi:flavin reductase (DIM6/NTAB) family NADH-FMN oxidoreductase RutF
MYYDVEDPAYYLNKPTPFKACVIPRPIAWVTTQDAMGVVNIAPFSYFNAVADNPPMVMLAIADKEKEMPKDSLRNILETGECVINMVSFAQAEAMNVTSATLPYGTSELSLVNLPLLPSQKVKPPCIGTSKIHLECRHWQTIELPVRSADYHNHVTFLKVVAIHIDDAILTEDGKIDPVQLDVIARLGYGEYTRMGEVFTMKRPK